MIIPLWFNCIIFSKIKQFNIYFLCSVLLDEGLELVAGADDLLELLAVLEEEEGGDGGDAVLSREVAGLVDVDLEEDDVGVLLGEGDELGGHHPAGAAPGGEEVDDDELAGSVGHLGVPLLLVVNDDNLTVTRHF